MAKRRPYADGEAPRKRPRVVHEAPTSEEVTSSRQLMQLLAFDQDLVKARHGIQSFKLLLDKLNDPPRYRPEDAALLHSYLNATPPRRDDADDTDDKNDKTGDEAETDPVFLPDVFDTWDYAARHNHDGLQSAVPVVLALLIRHLSRQLDMAPFCLGLCRTLLRRRPLELIAHNLSADRGKEYIISPTLRLLRETLTFDGGAVAKPLFRARSHTYRALARNMGLRHAGDGVEDAARTSVRTNAVRFFLASLTFLHPEAKAELLAQRDVVHALTRTIKDDPPHLVHDILATLRDHVLKDKTVQRSSRARLFTAATLVRLAGLYTYAHDDKDAPPIADSVHELLLYVCTTPGVGVLRDQNGYYPQGVEPNATDTSGDGGDDVQLGVGLDGIAWIDKFGDAVPVFNLALAEFLSSLRPWSSVRQSALAIAIVQSAPELAAWYFLDRQSFTFEPKMSATWVGYAAFLFNAIRIDIPPFFGHKMQYARVPPPTSVLVDNILPRPLSQKTLGRCLAQPSKLVPFFAARLLVVAMEKLRRALDMHRAAAARFPLESLWRDAERRAIDEFCRRCPPMKDVVLAYRAIDAADLLYREAVSRLLRLYYEVVPQVALTSKFDVAPHLFSAVRQVDEHAGAPHDKAILLMDLENLLAIAGYSPGMQWFSKARGLAASPYTALLKVYTEAESESAGPLRSVLDFVAREHQLFDDEKSSEGLVASLPVSGALSDPVWAFVDNCIVRCATAPIKYIAMMPEFGGGAFDPLTMALVEQLRFATDKATPDTHATLLDFLARYLATCRGDKTGLAAVATRLASAFSEAHAQAVLANVSRVPEAPKASKALEVDIADVADIADSSMDVDSADNDDAAENAPLETLLDLGPVRAHDTAALSRWMNKSADELVEDGLAADVIALLAADDASVRRQALLNLTSIAAQVRASSYDEKDQVWLLLSELIASVRAWMTDDATAALPVPGHIVSFAAHALDVLRNPLHCLYAKINTFLTAGPVWRLRAFPLVADIVHAGPSEDDAYYTEISWLLSYLIAGLRTPADVDCFRARRLFETVVSVASNPYMRAPLRRQVLRLVARVAAIDGGSTTLITRSGIVSWLTARQAAHATAHTSTKSSRVKRDGRDGNSLDEFDEPAAIHALLNRLWETCDRARVDGWSMHGVRRALL